MNAYYAKNVDIIERNDGDYVVWYFNHGDADGDSRSGSKEKIDKMPKAPPTRTITYKVEPSDTLTSVAARFDTTPSELAILNRLPSRCVFPGQIIRVPDKKRLSVDTECSQLNSESTERCSIPDEGSESETGSTSRRLSGSDHKDDVNVKDGLSCLKPGHSERVHSPSHAVTQPKQVRPFERFLKINVKHITDGQGVVGGVLLVTPNAVMFDPNVSDQLVIEHGPESYGVIAPMEFVVNAAIYHDIAHMRVAHTPHNSSDSGGKPEIYHASEQQRRDSLYRPKEDNDQHEEAVGETEEADNAEHIVTNQTDSLDSTTLEIQSSPGGKADSLLAKDDTFPELRSSTEEEDNGSVCSCDEERPGNAFPKAFDSDLIVKKSNHLLKRSDEFSEKEDLSHSGDERRTESPASLPPDNEENTSETNLPLLVEAETVIKRLEERRQSSLDQHWAIPNKIRSLENECPAADDDVENEHSENQSGRLIKQSCHDSGIDIRDPSLVGASRKTTYSDADIMLSEGADFVPPKPLRPLSQGDDESSPSTRKSTSVSFSLDDSKESSLDNSSSKQPSNDDADKQSTDSKKKNMLKRLSYPLAWMENIAGEKDDKESSLPSSAESSHPSHSSSVFSKVFSSSPINTLTDFSTGLFLTKTPSEESSNKFQFPPSGILSTNSSSQPNLEPSAQHQQQHHQQQQHHRHHQRCATISSSSVLSNSHKKEGFVSSFSPSTLISNVGRSSVSSFIRQQHHNRSDSTKSAGPRLDYRSMVSVEDMPELFVSFDKLIPRPARSCEDPPLYLRLRMGKPLNRRIPKTTPIMSYGKKKMRPEYWFSVPRNRVDDLYKFLNIWVPHLYGDLDEDVVTERGYELVNSDTELWDDDDTNGEDEKKMHRRGSDADSNRDSWEVIKAPYAKIYNLLKNQADQFGSSDTQPSDEVLSIREELQRALYSSSTSLDLELFLPDLNGKTEILTEDHRRQLCRYLPARAEGYSWTLVFSTSQHGYSLNFMYRKMNRIDSPILMVIQDTESNVFGALTSCTLRVSDHFYGNGESLLFTFTPEFQIYNWTGENLYFIKGNNESLSIGAGDGKFGIWLDGDLYQGRTQPCNTYGNEPLVPGQDFIIKTLECWAFL